jgi:type IV secretory pathway VirB2 component (pilin)
VAYIDSLDEIESGAPYKEYALFIAVVHNVMDGIKSAAPATGTIDSVDTLLNMAVDVLVGAVDVVVVVVNVLTTGASEPV